LIEQEKVVGDVGTTDKKRNSPAESKYPGSPLPFTMLWTTTGGVAVVDVILVALRKPFSNFLLKGCQSVNVYVGEKWSNGWNQTRRRNTQLIRGPRSGRGNQLLEQPPDLNEFDINDKFPGQSQPMTT
jgi:hypothetical protein